MKRYSFLCHCLLSLLLSLHVAAQYSPFSYIQSLLQKLADSPSATPPFLAMPPVGVLDAAPGGSTGVIISDVIGKSQNIAIFSSLTRDIDAVAARLDDAGKNTTVLAPDNAAIKSLPRKPWEDPKEYAELGESAYHGKAGEDRAHANMRRFVEAHIVPESPWKEHQKVRTLAGNTVWYESKGGKMMVSGRAAGVDFH